MFIRKKITAPKTLGELLKQARMARQISLEQISQGTKIIKKYLVALERGDYQKLPGQPYVWCFIKYYCQYLRLDEAEFVRLYNKEEKIIKNLNGEPDFRQPVKKISRLHMLVAPKIIRNIITVLILIICLVYLGKKIQAIVKPPTLTITAPATDLITTKNVIQITGQTEPETNLIINGQKILVQPDGRFVTQMFLQPGINTIKITAKKRHGGERVEYRRVVAEETN